MAPRHFCERLVSDCGLFGFSPALSLILTQMQRYGKHTPSPFEPHSSRTGAEGSSALSHASGLRWTCRTSRGLRPSRASARRSCSDTSSRSADHAAYSSKSNEHLPDSTKADAFLFLCSRPFRASARHMCSGTLSRRARPITPRPTHPPASHHLPTAHHSSHITSGPCHSAHTTHPLYALPTQSPPI